MDPLKQSHRVCLLGMGQRRKRSVRTGDFGAHAGWQLLHQLGTCQLQSPGDLPSPSLTVTSGIAGLGTGFEVPWCRTTPRGFVVEGKDLGLGSTSLG